MKKGQIEMIGMVVIVLIIVVGFLLYIRLSVFKEKDQGVTMSYQTIYAGNALSAMIKFNNPSCSMNVGDMIVHFSSGGDKICNVNDEDSLKKLIFKILDNIVREDKSFSSYYLNIERYGQNYMEIDSLNCKKESLGVFGPEYMLSNGLKLKLKICKKH